MTRVLIVIPRTRYRDAVEALYGLRSLHIYDHREGRHGLELGKPLEGASEASVTLIRLRAMIATLELGHRVVDRPLPADVVIRELESRFDHLESEIETLGENRNRLRNELRNIEARLASLEPFIALGLDLDVYRSYESLEVFVGSTTGDLFRAMGRTDLNYELFKPKDPSKSGLWALFVDTDRADEARTVLGELSFSPTPIYEGQGDPRAERVALREGLAKVRASLEEVEHELRTITNVHGDSLVAAEEHLSILVEKAESPLRCASTPNSILLEGWVPSKAYHDLRRTLEDAVGDAFHIEVLDDVEEARITKTIEVAADGGEPDEAAEEHEDVDASADVPVLLMNPKHVKVHEDLVDLVSRPRYDEIDPALFMFVTFPIMFGMMVGDIGYGVAFIMLGWMLLAMEGPKGFAGRHWRGIGIFEGVQRTRMIKMIMLCGFVTAVWGFLYGEAFGFELYGRHGELTHKGIYLVTLDLWLPISRLEEASLLLVLCIYLGVAHLLLGLVLGFFNEKGRHGLGHAFLAKGSWMLIVIGGLVFFKVFLGADEVDWGAPSLLGGLVVMVLGIVLLLAGEGMFGVLELPSILSNVLSYTRLFAIGLSSLGIALAFNNIAGLMWGSGVGGMVGAAVIFFLGHTVNLFLALLAPSLHALRLHYVEWMTKFFVGGGVIYKPFGRERVYTEV